MWLIASYCTEEKNFRLKILILYLIAIYGVKELRRKTANNLTFQGRDLNPGFQINLSKSHLGLIAERMNHLQKHDLHLEVHTARLIILQFERIGFVRIITGFNLICVLGQSRFIGIISIEFSSGQNNKCNQCSDQKNDCNQKIGKSCNHGAFIHGKHYLKNEKHSVWILMRSFKII